MLTDGVLSKRKIRTASVSEWVSALEDLTWMDTINRMEKAFARILLTLSIHVNFSCVKHNPRGCPLAAPSGLVGRDARVSPLPHG